MFYLRMGFRNIAKNFRRSLFTMLAIVVGMIACLLTHAFFNWNIIELREAMIRNGTGHYQLFAAGFTKNGGDEPFQYLIPDADPIVAKLRKIPGVKLVTARMAFNGILSSGEKSTVVVGEAGIPGNERRLHSYAHLIGGRPLNSHTPDGLIIGDGVRRKLSAKVGDTLTLMANMNGGGINAVDFKLEGVTRSGVAELDNVSAAAPLPTIQSLEGVDESVQRIVVLLDNTEETKRVLPGIKAICRQYNLEYRDWQSLAEFYKSLKMMYDAIFVIIMLIVLMIVTFTISNTVNMNINDRIREIGTIRALGTRRVQVASIILSESALMGLIGSLAGLIAGGIFIGMVEIVGGLPVRIVSAGKPVWLHVFFRPAPAAIGACILLFTLVAIVASGIPARKASRISITDALRWI